MLVELANKSLNLGLRGVEWGSAVTCLCVRWLLEQQHTPKPDAPNTFRKSNPDLYLSASEITVRGNCALMMLKFKWLEMQWCLEQAVRKQCIWWTWVFSPSPSPIISNYLFGASRPLPRVRNKQVVVDNKYKNVVLVYFCPLVPLTHLNVHSTYTHPAPPSTPARWLLTGPSVRHQHPLDDVIQQLVRGRCVSVRDSFVFIVEASDEVQTLLWSQQQLADSAAISYPGSAPLLSSSSCLNVHQLGRHCRLGMFALKMLLEGLGVWHLCLEKEDEDGFRLFDLVVTNKTTLTATPVSACVFFFFSIENKWIFFASLLLLLTLTSRERCSQEIQPWHCGNSSRMQHSFA